MVREAQAVNDSPVKRPRLEEGEISPLSGGASKILGTPPPPPPQVSSSPASRMKVKTPPPPPGPNCLYPLVVREGAVVHPGHDKSTAICVIANSCGRIAYATSGMLEREYAHANLYRCRRPLYTTTRAITRDRCHTGTIAVREAEEGPTIVYLVAHHGPGKALEYNDIALRQLKTSSDKHYVAGLSEDTLSDRLKNMNDCLIELFYRLPSLKPREILFPVESEGGSWSYAYIPLLQNFASRCMSVGVPVVLMNLPSDYLPAHSPEHKQIEDANVIDGGGNNEDDDEDDGENGQRWTPEYKRVMARQERTLSLARRRLQLV